ncbi:MAG: DNRLRE domain-containing protein, partial [Solirubrobacterales bacterium]
MLLLAFLAFVAHFGIAWAEGETPSEGEAPARVEIPSARTETSDTYRLPSGALQTKISSAPINYETPNGIWAPIEEDLEESSEGGFSNGAASFKLHLPEQLDSGAVRISEDEQWVSYRLLGAETEAAEVEGSQASYEAEGGEVTFDLASIASGVKEGIVLNDPSAPREYRFELDASAGLEPTLAEDGSVEFRDSAGHLFATIPAPTISESQSEGPSAPLKGPVSYSLAEGDDGTWTLTLEVDSEWLANPERRWPITIDPTVTVAQMSDCMISNTPSPNGTGFCKKGEAPVEDAAYINPRSGEIYRTLLRFSGISLPADATVESTRLSLYSRYEASVQTQLETRALAWDYNENVRWTEPGVSSEPLYWTPGGQINEEGKAELSSAQRGRQPGWWNFESPSLRRIVAAWLDGSKPNYGILVKQKNEAQAAGSCESEPPECELRYFGFNTDNAPEAGTAPKMTITWYKPAPATSIVSSPKEGTTTARRLRLQAAWSPETAGVTGVRFQYRARKTGTFETIPASLVREENGNEVKAWPVAIGPGVHQSPVFFFDAAHADHWVQLEGGSIQVRALFDGPMGVEGYSAPVETKVDRYIGGPKDATAEVGPGTLDLLTGNLTISRQDVSVPGFTSSLAFSRTFNTRTPGTGDEGVLGRGWKPGAPVEEAGGSEWRSIKVVHVVEEAEEEEAPYEFDYAMLTSNEGFEIP